MKENAKPVDAVVPQSRAEARHDISYAQLILTGRAVYKRGPVLVMSYAGPREPDERTIALRHTSGKAVKRSMILFLRELRRAESDREYNRIVDQIVGQVEQAASEYDRGELTGLQVTTDTTVDVPAPQSEPRPPRPALQIHHVHSCNLAPLGVTCSFDWTGHSISPTSIESCQCGSTIDDTNRELDGTVFVVHQGVG